MVSDDNTPKDQRQVSPYSLATRLIYGKAVSDHWDYTHQVVPPIIGSSTFRLDSAGRGAKGFTQVAQPPSNSSGELPIYIYDRIGEPTTDMLQDALADAEGGEICVTFATGMAAIAAATLFSLRPAAEIIAHKTIYGCTYSLFTTWFPRMGYKVLFADLTDPEALLPLVNDKTQLVYLESPANPTLELLDTSAITGVIAAINQKRPLENQILSVFDNTFATPFCQRPLSHGADIVLHSLTKGICGFGTEMGGAVITRQKFFEPLVLFRKDFGSNLAPNAAWHILVYGLPSLPLRIRHQQTTALAVAEFLASHRLVDTVNYPGLSTFPQFDLAQKLLRDFDDNFAPGTLIYFTITGNDPEHCKKRGEIIMDFIASNAYAITLAVSLGQIRSLLEHPGSMTHSAYPAAEQLKAGIDPAGIRLSIGAESTSDIIRDLAAAFKAAEAG